MLELAVLLQLNWQKRVFKSLLRAVRLKELNRF